MYDPNSAIPEEAQPVFWRRFDAWRGERHQRFTARNAGRLRSWRNRRTYRRVVIAQMTSVLVMLLGAVPAFFDKTWFVIPFVGGALATLVWQRILRIITGSIGDAPVTALDEIQLAQRNSARSLAFIVLFTLMFIPYLVLIGLSVQDEVAGQTVYGVAILLVSLLLSAGVLPSMLIAWWMADPDPDDYEVIPALPDTPGHLDPAPRDPTHLDPAHLHPADQKGPHR
ncbi:hypothetical protein [Gordonia sp. NB41Y]|uniref:hypothetical protein n=1 Tax=Gordonia sp. NB41Y TaxID=875808 RepID=UPI00273CACB9|nr:hypothetical protein [Gordonia sp. NB41Y]WLP91989.1 hypothetical protein Q9K23_07050 [Gordonia sp. NB41Y]